MTKKIYKPDWQKGRKTDLKNEIMIKLSTGEFSIAKLAKELGHEIKTGDHKGEIDHQRVYNAITGLRDFFSDKKDGFVEQTEYFPDDKKRGRHGKIWRLTKNGILSLSKIQNSKEFFEMIFFQYDNHYKHGENNIDLSQLLSYYEIGHKLYRNKINSEINIIIWNKVKNLFFTNDYNIEFVPILKRIALKKEMTKKEIEDYSKSKEYKKTPYGILLSCIDKGLIMKLDNNYCLSLFGFLSLISSYSIIKTDYNKTLKNEIKQILDNHKFLFPRILNRKEFSIFDLTEIFRKIFLGNFSIEDNELSLTESRLLTIQSYFEKIEQTKFRIFFKQYISAYRNWCNKQDCHVLPFSSDFNMNSIFSINLILNEEFMKEISDIGGPFKQEIIKAIVNEKKHKIEFKTKGIHDEILEYVEELDEGDSESFDPTDQDLYEPDSKLMYEELLDKLNNLVINSLKENSPGIKGGLDEVLSDFEEDKKILKQKIIKAYEDITRISKCMEPLLELRYLSEKIEKISEFDIPVDQTIQSFDSLEYFSNDENIKSMQNIIEFQFFTYLKSVNPVSFKNVFLKSGLSDWYEEWVQTLIEFHNNENIELEQLSETIVYKILN